MGDGLARIRSLMTLTTGDEKHDPSAHSTLDVLLTPAGIQSRIESFLLGETNE